MFVEARKNAFPIEVLFCPLCRCPNDRVGIIHCHNLNLLQKVGFVKISYPHAVLTLSQLNPNYFCLLKIILIKKTAAATVIIVGPISVA